MGKSIAPMPTAPALVWAARIPVERKTTIPQVNRCQSCAAPMKGAACEHCGSEHQ